MSAPDAQPQEWSRRHLLIVLGVLAAVLVLLLAGLGYAIWSAIDGSAANSTGSTTSPDRTWPANSQGVRGERYRDALAADQMLQTRAGDLKPAPPALRQPAWIMVGPSSTSGPGGVPGGYAHTPSGAVGQLGALEVATLVPMSLQQARSIFEAWSMEGARFGRWELAQAIRSFHASAGTVDGDPSIAVTARPVGAQVKGTDGPDWVLACVQLDVSVTVVEQTRFGYGHCERMQWCDGRWMIAPGRPPAPAPSTWPGSQRSLNAGWRTWVDEKAAEGR